MRLILGVLVAALAGYGSAAAQAPAPRQEPPSARVACPPNTNSGDSPTTGQAEGAKPLSDKLAESNGVICPPTGVDSQMQVPPPGGGRLKVIPPPGTPGGDPNVQPK